jgi:hypothetical protein
MVLQRFWLHAIQLLHQATELKGTPHGRAVGTDPQKHTLLLDMRMASVCSSSAKVSVLATLAVWCCHGSPAISVMLQTVTNVLHCIQETLTCKVGGGRAGLQGLHQHLHYRECLGLHVPQQKVAVTRV